MTNDTLSQRRAQSCVNFLVDSLGIDPERLVAKGYGERIPRKLERDIVSRGITFKKGTVLTPEYINALPRNQQEAAHDLNRRTEFLILRDDYVPKTGVKPVASGEGRVKIITENSIPIDMVNGSPRGTCYVNSKTFKFLIENNSDTVKISYDQAMKFLKEAIFTVGDFDLKEKAIDDKDGTIIDRSIVYFNTLQVGDEVLENVEAIIIKGLKETIVIGKEKFIEEFGDYELNEKEGKLIFK